MKKKGNYIFTSKRHSPKAIMSTILGILSTASLGIVIYLTYRRGGAATAGYGVTGLSAAVYSGIGLVLGIITVQDKECYRLFPCLGLLLNLAALGAVGLILYMGAYA